MRFLLSPDQDTMKTRSSSQTKIVRTTEPKEEEFKFGSANKWGLEQLDKLGVTFWRNKKFNLEKMLNIKESDWSDVMKQSFRPPQFSLILFRGCTWIETVVCCGT